MAYERGSTTMPGDGLRIGITCYPSSGGSGIVATELGKRLARRGHHVHFICHQVPIRLREFHPNICFHPVEAQTYPVFHHPPYTLNLAAKMSEVAEQHRLDLLHVHYAIPHAASAILARQIVQSRQLRVLTTLHGTDITLVGHLPSFFSVTRFSIDQSDGVSVVSQWLADQTREIFGTTRPLEVVHNFVDPERFTPHVSREGRSRFADPDERLVMHASNFRSVKNTPRVVEVFDGIQREVPSRLMMIGEGPDLPICERRVRELGLEDRVHFLGSQEYIESLLPLADLFVLPSEHESFGLVALEAMSCGVPVVATDQGGVTEVVEEGVTGFLIDPTDVPEMVARGVAILAEPGVRESMGEAARLLAVGRFDIEDAVRRYEQLYRTLIDEPAPTPSS